MYGAMRIPRKSKGRGLPQKDDHTVVLKDATKDSECDDVYADMSKKGYRLPTEAEWEYAARWQGNDNTNADKYGNVWLTKLNSASGSKVAWKDAEKTGEVAWYGGNADSKTHPVGTKKANALGLHDISGNVWEWCFDRYDNNPAANDGAYESGGFVTDPQGAASGADRVERRGSWSDDARDCVVGIRRQRARCGHLRCRFTKNSPQRISTAKDGSGSNRYRVRSANSQTKNEHGCSFFCDGIRAASAINAQRSICTISYNKLIE